MQGQIKSVLVSQATFVVDLGVLLVDKMSRTDSGIQKDSP